MLIVIVACLIADMSSCKQYTLNEVEAQTPQQCLITGQPEMAAWNNAHPDRKIVRWRCVPPGLGEREI